MSCYSRNAPLVIRVATGVLCWHCGLASHLAADAVALHCCCFGAVFSKGCRARFQSSVRAHSWLVVALVFLRYKFVRVNFVPIFFKLHTVAYFCNLLSNACACVVCVVASHVFVETFLCRDSGFKGLWIRFCVVTVSLSNEQCIVRSHSESAFVLAWEVAFQQLSSCFSAI